MNKQVFVINGSGGCGKDTFVQFVGKYIPTENYSSVDRVKEIAKECLWDGSKDEKSRKFLSDLKNLLTEYNDLPFKCMQRKVNLFIRSDSEFLFLHIREPEEIERARRMFNAKTVLIVRDSVEHITSNMADANVLNYEYDYVIRNNGTLEDLELDAKEFILINK